MRNKVLKSILTAVLAAMLLLACMPAALATDEGKYTPSITFDANGGTIAIGGNTNNGNTRTVDGRPTDVSPVRFNLEDVIEKEQMKVTREGYTLLGWGLSSDAEMAKSSVEVTSANSNVTVYAIWECAHEKSYVYCDEDGCDHNEDCCPKYVPTDNPPAEPTPAPSYSVRFNPDCQYYFGAMDDQVMVYGKSEKLSDNEFYRVGYMFKGWATESKGKVVYEDEQSVKNLTTVDNGVVELYAVWSWYGNGSDPVVPTEEPTEAPTEEPTEAPTEEPTEAPTEEPTEAPTEEPTEAPTEEPTEAPTEEPTEAPTEEPTELPTEAPTQEPVEDDKKDEGDKDDEDDETVPKTGDNSARNGMFVAFAMMAATAVLAVCRMKSRKEN